MECTYLAVNNETIRSTITGSKSEFFITVEGHANYNNISLHGLINSVVKFKLNARNFRRL